MKKVFSVPCFTLNNKKLFYKKFFSNWFELYKEFYGERKINEIILDHTSYQKPIDMAALRNRDIISIEFEFNIRLETDKIVISNNEFNLIYSFELYLFL